MSAEQILSQRFCGWVGIPLLPLKVLMRCDVPGCVGVHGESVHSLSSHGGSRRKGLELREEEGGEL